MFLSDSPIKDKKHDDLNRGFFSNKLAEEILEWKSDESIVIALNGDWGVGKTSILNMVLSHIDNTTKKRKLAQKPIVVKFNPWNFSEQNDLLLAFLEQLSLSVADRIPPSKKNFKKDINEFAKALGALGKIPVLGTALNATGDVINYVVPEETLEDLRNKVNSYFKQLKCKVIIIIDDIDRLTQKEIRQIFRLIKINGDFPNTIYITAFDRLVVEKALDTEQGISGRDFLEKIIQVGFDVPAIESKKIEGYLFPRLDAILNSVNIKYWDQHRWSNFYFSGLGKLFESLRDVKRFINSLSFTIKLVKNEINPIDFIGIEAIRVFWPDVYRAIGNNKFLFTDRSNTSESQDKLSEKRTMLEGIFALAGDKSKLAGDICLELFPQIRPIFPRPLLGSSSGNQSTWRRERRICSKDVFDFYFILGIPTGEISQSELQKVTSLTTEQDELESLFRNYIQQKRISRLLDLLNDILPDLTDEGALGLSNVLLKILNELDTQGGISALGDDFKAQLLVFQSLKKIQNQDIRFTWLLEQIQQSTTLYPVFLQVGWNLPDKNDPRSELLFSEQQLKSFTDACVSKIETYDVEGKLVNEKNLANLIGMWKNWAPDTSKPQKFIDNLTSTSHGTITFVESFAYEREKFTFGDYVAKREVFIDFDKLRKHMDIDKLKGILSNLTKSDKDKLSEKQKHVIGIILKDS